jgi:hypothetical protein
MLVWYFLVWLTVRVTVKFLFIELRREECVEQLRYLLKDIKDFRENIEEQKEGAD